MPGVQIWYREGIIGLQEKRIITAAVRRFGVAQFWAPELKRLEEEDFFVKYVPPDEGDELADDIVVSIPLHQFPSRLENTDEKAGGLADAIKNALVDSGYRRSISIGVPILVCEIGWGRSVLDAGTLTRRMGRRALSSDPEWHENAYTEREAAEEQ